MRANGDGPLLPDPQEGEEGPLDERRQDESPDDGEVAGGKDGVTLLEFLCHLDD